MSLTIPDTHRVTLLPSTTNTGNTATAGDAKLGLDRYSRALLFLTVSDKTMDASTTLDIYVQYSPDYGTTWDDIAHFAQVTNAAVGDGTYVMVLNHGTAGIADRATDDGATITANSVRNQPWCDRMRIKYDGANFSGSDTITIKVDAWFFQ
jgi:hypothetical protein